MKRVIVLFHSYYLMILFESEQAVLKLLDSFFDQLVRAYDLKLHEDFEKNVYFEEYSVVQ